MTDTFDTTEKKSERLEVRLGYREKGAFVEACEMQGDWLPTVAVFQSMLAQTLDAA